LSLLSLLVLVAAILGGVAYATMQLGRAITRASRDRTICQLQAMFVPAMQAAERDPQQLLTWYPMAQASRRLFPEACAALDAAIGHPFPFTQAQLQDAHARWTASWLAWERSHDGEYALKASALQEELKRNGDLATPLGRARVAALEREKLERYQDRYHEYIRAAKAFQALLEPSTSQRE
jgi:hypothetical protein